MSEQCKEEDNLQDRREESGRGKRGVNELRKRNVGSVGAADDGGADAMHRYVLSLPCPHRARRARSPSYDGCKLQTAAAR